MISQVEKLNIGSLKYSGTPLLEPLLGQREVVWLEGWSYYRGGPKWCPGLDGLTLSIEVIYTYMILVFIIHYGEI